ncbi:N-acetyltransferase [Microbaculum marinum]|uniref:N-acetyltransferase n=1 Tax=Microbaculum marinum TaxID=1764581 RepID=A0AAW9RP42_9HYPH
MIMIASEYPQDGAEIDALLDDSFGPRRLMKTAERLREGRRPAEGLALVAFEGRSLVGTIRLWNIDAGSAPALLLGPVAVRRERRNLGIGAKLVETALKRATAQGHGAVILVGDAPYYGRFAFSRELTRDLSLPGPVDLDRFLGLELYAGALAGAKGMVRATGALVEQPDTEPFAEMDAPRVAHPY